MNEFYGFYPGFTPDEFYYEIPSAGTDLSSLAFVFNIAMLILIWNVVKYVFESFAVYTIAQNRGMKNAFFAFVPMLNVYYLGKVADDIEGTMNKKTDYSIRLLLFNTVSTNLLAISLSFFVIFASMEAYFSFLISVLLMFVASALEVTYLVYRFIVLYKIFKEYSPNNAALFIIFSLIFDIDSVFLFAVRNNKSGYRLWTEQQAKREAAPEQEPVYMDGYSQPAETPAPEADPQPAEQPTETPEPEETPAPSETPEDAPSDTENF